MPTPRLTIVTPSYQQARFLPATLASVASQSFPAWEHWVVDGGSGDGTVAILRRASATEPRLRWCSKRDGGQANAVNKGIARAAGDLVGWLNSDDVYAPGVFRTIVAAFDSDPTLDLVYGDGWHVDEVGALLDRYPTGDWSLRSLLRRCVVCQPTVFFRRALWARLGPLDERLHYCMDYEYWLRAAAAGVNVRRLPTVLAGSRLHRDAKTIDRRLDAHVEQNDLLREKFGATPLPVLLDYAFVAAGADHLRGRPRPQTLLNVVRIYRQAVERWRPAGSARGWGKAMGALTAGVLAKLGRGLFRRGNRRPVKTALPTFAPTAYERAA